MKPRQAMTFIEIMIAVLIMAMAIIPIADMLSFVTRGTKDDKSEVEAMQFACDLMDHILMRLDYNPAGIASPTWQELKRGQTDLRYKVYTAPIPWSQVSIPKIEYHDACANGQESTSGIDGKIVQEFKPLKMLDLETLDRVSIANPDDGDFDLCDIKVVVMWRPTGHADYASRPIILYSRKARL